MFDLSGRVALVTGASSGLGERFARVLHAAGATVVITARRADLLRDLSGELGTDWIEADLATDTGRVTFANSVAEHTPRSTSSSTTQASATEARSRGDR